ncbi:hypothetical protein [Novosphingobium malaysiense]|uniref:hypothetical protein n=1 Tax=Novosphingobium malaysiense TaxID=1348853 RepID=UPI000A7531A9
MAAVAFLAVFAAGMVATHWEAVSTTTGLDRLTASDCPFMLVHDGDTIRCGAERIRIMNIDAPELEGSPRCSLQSIRRLSATHNPP